MATRRQERINGLIVQEVSRFIRDLKDPRIGFVTITRAEVSGDMHHARVFISIFGENADEKTTLEGLNSSAGFLRRELGRTLSMKYTPQLEFHADNSLASTDIMSRLIREARATDPHPTDETTDDTATNDSEDGTEEE